MRYPVKDTNLFLQGQKDCEKGVPHTSGKGSDYDRGYADQYELEQERTHLSVTMEDLSCR